jgi:hypothetical protein
MTRVVRHSVTGRRRDVGVEVGARVGPVRRWRGEDAGCNKKQDRQCTYNVIVVRPRNNCCYGNSTMRSLPIVVGLHVAVINMKPLSVTTEKQEWVPFAL